MSLIWECLFSAYMPAEASEAWLKTATEFYARTTFPNCVGAVDGKHIRIKKPNESGSAFQNYLSYYSIVLMAVAYADYCFVSIEAGALCIL